MIGWLPNPIRDFVQRSGIAILGGALVISASVATWQTVRIEGVDFGIFSIDGLADKVGTLSTKLAKVEGERDDALASAAKSEALRGQEQAQAAQSYTEASQRCDARITTARDAAAAIEEITNAQIPVDVRGPVGRIVPAGQLRRIIGQAAPGGAAGVSGGGDQPKGQ